MKALYHPYLEEIMFKRETCMDARWIKCSVLDCSVDTGLHVDIFNTGFYYIVDSLQENGF